MVYHIQPGDFLRENMKKRLEEMLPEGTRLSVGSIKGGVFGNLVSEDISIFSGSEAPLFNVGKIELEYRLWHPFISRIPNLPDMRVSRFRINCRDGTVDLNVGRKGEKFIIRGGINHVKIYGIDIVSSVTAHMDVNGKEPAAISLVFKDMVINYKPFDREVYIFLSYDKAKDVIDVTRFGIKGELEGYGSVRLTPQNHIFLKWAIRDLALKEYFLPSDGKLKVNGVLNGNFTLKGPLREARLSAHLNVQGGNFGDFRFDSIIANLVGEGPVIQIHETRISKKDGYMTLSGEVDLRKLRDKKPFEKVSLKTEDNLFFWQDWSVSKKNESSLVEAEKFLDKDFKLSFKARTENANSEEEHFLGVKHEVKF